MEKFDIVVIGSGPGGYSAAIKASQLGFKTACIEADKLGGTCLNWGCIPTKALLRSAETYELIKNASSVGINIEKEPSINFENIIKRSRQIADFQEKGIKFLFKKNKVENIKGYAKFKDKNTIIVSKEHGENIEITSNKFIIATGGKPKNLPNIKFDGEKIITSREAMTLKKQPQKMIIIGAGAIGVEFAYFYSTIGTEIVLLEAQSKLLPTEDEEISKLLEREFKKKNITVHTEAYVQDIKHLNDIIQISFKDKKGEIKSVNGDTLLISIGITPNIENLGLDILNIEMDKNFIKINRETYETNITGIFAIGDVINTPALAHIATYEGITCVKNIKNKDTEKPIVALNYRITPRCIYCHPQISAIGLTESEAIKKGYSLKIGKQLFRANGKANALGDTTGFVKIIFDADTDKILGCHMIGADVTELIAEISLAMESNSDINSILNTIHPHPTLSESIMEASANAYEY